VREVLNGGGKHSLREFLAGLEVRYVDEAEMQAAGPHSFFDLDTPQDVALAITMRKTG
jgi:molybdopterin-guanine dinucleotide biosynthesis protein A